jgi:hypothetical protein
MEFFVLPPFDHDCTLIGTRFDDVSAIAPECTPGLEGEDGGPFCEGHCFAGGGKPFARRVSANFLFWSAKSPLYTSAPSTMFDDQTGWGTSGVVSTGDVVKDAMRKEQIIK